MIRFTEEKNIQIKDLGDRELKKYCPYLNKKVIEKIFNPYFVIKRRSSTK